MAWWVEPKRVIVPPASKMLGKRGLAALRGPEPHRMWEEQVNLALEGPLDQPHRVYASRAGEVTFKRHGGVPRQSARALTVGADCHAQLEDMEEKLLTRLVKSDLRPRHAKIQFLIRRRWTDDRERLQSFEGYWGTCTHADGQCRVFGGKPGSDPVFRRGPWDLWPQELPRIRDWNPRLPMILSPFCGTLLHETVGHALEADYLGDSPIMPFLGKRLAIDALTVQDRPDLPGFPGSMAVDDSGRLASQTTLIHRGFLVGDLDLERGVYRRASYRDLPQIRATNFAVGPGPDLPDEWRKSLARCYYITSIQSGNWKPGSSLVRFLTGPVYQLEQGEPVARLEWCFLEFETQDLLARIEAVGQDLVMDPVVHWCVKKHQAVPIGLASPSLLLGGRKS